MPRNLLRCRVRSANTKKDHVFQPAAQVELVMTAAVGFGLAAVFGGILPTWAVQNGWVCGVEGPAQWKGEVWDRPAASIGPVLHPRMGLER